MKHVKFDEGLDGLRELYRRGMPPGCSTGWPALDRLITIGAGRVTVVTGVPNHGKALALDTRLPTPSGWTTMGQIMVGDLLFDECGKQCRVVAVTDAMVDRHCYEVEFSDGTVVTCDAAHEWFTRTVAARIAAKRGGTQGPSVITTREIADSLTVRGRANHAVPVAHALSLPAASLPLDPYVLGAWLGDGSSSDGVMTDAEGFVVAEIERRGFPVTKYASKYAWGVYGLKAALRPCGVLHAKHIPPIYQRASRSQRMDLLRGLMDTDGHCTPYGRCEFTSVKETLARGVYQLCAGLGFMPKLIRGRATINGRDCGEKFRVTFTPLFNVFLMPRKAARIGEGNGKRRHWRTIVRCDSVPSVPVKCVMVDSPSHLYLATDAMIPTHNSQWLDALAVNLLEIPLDSRPWRFMICSPEQQPLSLHRAKLLELYAGKRFRGGMNRMSEAEALAHSRGELAQRIEFVLMEERETFADLLKDAYSWCQGAIAKGWQPGVILDPWNTLEHNRPRDMTEHDYTGEALEAGRRLVKATGAHLFIVAHPTKPQPSRDGKRPIPDPYSISGSSHWFNRPDNCLCVWRMPMAQPGDSEYQCLHVLVQKVRWRHEGHQGDVTLLFEDDSGRFTDPERGKQPAREIEITREPGEDLP